MKVNVLSDIPGRPQARSRPADRRPTTADNLRFRDPQCNVIRAQVKHPTSGPSNGSGATMNVAATTADGWLNETFSAS